MQSNIIQEQLKAGVDAHVRGNLLAAESAYKTVLTLDQHNAAAHNNLGFIYGQQGDLQSAVSHLEQATQLNPTDATAFSNLGQIYYSIGEHEKGLEHLEKAVFMDNTHAQNWHNLARISLIHGNFQRAEYAWWRVYQLQPESLDALVNFSLAIAAQNRFHEAINILESVLNKAPQHFNALLHLGVCELMLRNYGNAEKILLNAYQMNSSDQSLLRHLALAELCLGNKQQACYFYEKLIVLYPSDENAHVDYLYLLTDMKLGDKARQALEDFIAQSPQSERALLAIDKLNRYWQTVAEKSNAANLQH